MKKSLLFLLLTIFSLNSFAYDCRDLYTSAKVDSYIDHLSEGQRHMVGFGSAASGLAVGVSFGTITLPVVLLAFTVASTPILVGEAIKGLKNKKENRMIRLINQAYSYKETSGTSVRSLFKRFHRSLTKNKSLSSLTMEELADSLIIGNENLSLCRNLDGIRELKSGTYFQNLDLL